MTVVALGISHRTAPLDLRSRFAFPADRLVPSIAALRQHLVGTRTEAAILSTCNRTEIYVAANDADVSAPVLDWLARQAGVAPGDVAGHAYTRADTAAARHAFRVASGLDSAVLGEPQILGQMKQAARVAGAAGALGQTLHQLFQRSFAVAKAVRSGTEIGTCSVSYAAATVRLAQQIFGALSDCNVLCIGAGEMMGAVAAHFAGRAPRTLVFANRSADRSAALAAKVGARTMALAELPDRLAEFDVVVSCTASTLPLVGLGAVERALKARRRRPMLLVDLALPRDIEPEVAALDDAYLYTLDDLAAQTSGAAAQRQAAVARAEALVEDGVRDYGRWLDQRGSVPLIRALQQQAEDHRAVELARAKRRLARGESVDDVLAALANGLSAKLLHGSLHELQHGDAALHATVARMFSLPR